MRKRWSAGQVRAVSYLIAVILTLAGTAGKWWWTAEQHEQQISNHYQHAFAELTIAVTELDKGLQKSVYATTPAMLTSLCIEINGNCQAAQMALGELPYANVELEQTATLISKIGDYASSVAEITVERGSCSAEETNNLAGLSVATSSLAQTLLTLQIDIGEGTVTLEDLDAATKRLSAATEDGTSNVAGSSFKTMEAEFPEVPTLIYDGPFSQHLEGKTPKALEGLAEVDEATARKAAATFLAIGEETLTLVSAGAGNLPTFDFSAETDQGETYIEVTKQGGCVLDYFSAYAAGEATLTGEDAVGKALEFLTMQGFAEMKQSYYVIQSSVCTINFAPVKSNAICYTDLVKVRVALDTGEVVGFEANGYYVNHTDRVLQSPAVTEEQARGIVSTQLEILAVQLAVIPTDGEYEVQCYEFKCQNPEGKHYIVYVNAATGAEEKILILLEDENGTLTM